MQTPLWLIKWTKYEYWPVWFFFLPAIFLFWPLLAIRSRALLYFTATNPGIPLGGFFGEKKYDIIKSISPQYLPQTLLISKEKLPNAIELIQQAGFTFPLIIKPNVGERGTDVAKINSAQELEEHLQSCNGEIIAQEFITHPEEYGVLYYKYPDGGKKGIFSVVKKGFLYVTGDGQNTIEQLLQKNERARFQINSLRIEKGDLLKTIPPQGERVLVQSIGNHCKGTEFIDANLLINDSMVAAFEKIAQQIPGFYYGRFDVKAPSDEHLQRGEGIKVMEVNGATSEPGHIYDMHTMTLLKAWRDVWKSMEIIQKIGLQNHNQYKVPYSPIKEFLTTLYQHFFKRN